MITRTTIEFSFFVGLVAVGHLALVAPDLDEGLQSAGAGGHDLLSAIASNGAIAAMVETWESPPEVVEIPDTPVVPIPDASPTATPAMETPPPMLSAPDVTLALSRVDAPPLPMASPPAVLPQPPTLESKPERPEASALEKSPSSSKPPVVTKPVEKVQKVDQKDKKREDVPTAKQSSQASKSQAARQAKGTGGNTAKGQNGREETASLSDSKRTSLMKKWGAQIRTRLAHKAPDSAGKGVAYVRITVLANGQVKSAALVKSSGNKKLDTLALNAVKRAGRMPKAPAKLQVASQQFTIPIRSR